ncbi:MAG: glycosyltransferase [Candidatus Omnitrophica bacterium]|nr:glycosyltransferase [Candidatus Omnitrophota bacterium]
MARQDPDVAIVVPILNEEKSILSLLESFERLTLFPKEVVLVDGGSTDHTVEVITRYLEGREFPYNIQVMILAQALPGRGRNEGVRKTSCTLIACTDAGGHVDSHWLEDLVEPLKADPACEMVIGNCRPDAKNFFERCTFYATLEARSRKPFIFSGSASIAFRKRLWEKVGGYPEWLYPCEDKYFLAQVQRKRGRPVFSKRAVVYWKSRPTLWSFLKQYFLYGRGDGEGSFVPYRYFLRILFYGSLLLLLSQGQKKSAAALLIGYLGFVTFRGFLRLKDVRAIFYLPLLFLIKDLSQLSGYFVGFFRRDHGAR